MVKLVQVKEDKEINIAVRYKKGNKLTLWSVSDHNAYSDQPFESLSEHPF